MKTSLNKLTLIFLAAVLAACGRLEKDPIKNYESLNDAQPPTVQNNDSKSTMTTLFFIDTEDDLTFVQGLAQEAKFRVRHTFANPDGEVQYALKLKAVDALPGAKLTMQAKDLWVLKWQPSGKLLGQTENLRKFKIDLQIVLLETSSPSVKKQFYGQDDLRPFVLTLMKDLAQPVISERIDFLPAATINPDQKLKIQFTVSAKGMLSADDLDVFLTRGPEAVSSELAQLDALEGIRSARAKRVKSLGLDKMGRNQYLYEISFDARPFVDLVLAQIQNQPVLREKHQNGVLTSAEALFFVEVINKYNGGRSAQKTIQFTVNLNDTAGTALLAGSESLELSAGSKSSEQFFIRSSDSRSNLKVLSFEYKAQKIDLKNGVAELKDGETSYRIACSAGTQNLNEHFGCKVGKCYQSCRVEASASCAAAAGANLLKINAQTEMGKKSEDKSFDYRVIIKGKSTVCQGAVAP